jgi:hypothetical protein
VAFNQPDPEEGGDRPEEDGSEAVSDGQSRVAGEEGGGVGGQGAIGGEPAEAAGADGQPEAAAGPGVGSAVCEHLQQHPEMNAPEMLTAKVSTGIPAQEGISTSNKYRRPVPAAPPAATRPMLAPDR